MKLAVVFLAALLALPSGCGTHPRESDRTQAARLRSTYAKYLDQYRASIEEENRLIGESLNWLNGSAITESRTGAVRAARQLENRWAKVYFIPRYMHEQLRFDEYSSTRVRRAQTQLLDQLKQRYFELHDFERYAKHASESEMHHTPAGRLPEQLVEFRRRLEARAPAVDRISPILDSMTQ